MFTRLGDEKCGRADIHALRMAMYSIPYTVISVCRLGLSCRWLCGVPSFEVQHSVVLWRATSVPKNLLSPSCRFYCAYSSAWPHIPVHSSLDVCFLLYV